MPEVQSPVLEHAAPKAVQTSRLDGRLADASLPESKNAVKEVTVRKTDYCCRYTVVVGKWGTNEILSMTEPVYSLVE